MAEKKIIHGRSPQRRTQKGEGESCGRGSSGYTDAVAGGFTLCAFVESLRVDALSRLLAVGW